MAKQPEVRPDRRRSQDALFHLCRQVRGAERFPLHIHDWAQRAAKSDVDAVVEHPDSGTDGEGGDGGMYSHVTPPPCAQGPEPRPPRGGGCSAYG